MPIRESLALVAFAATLAYVRMTMSCVDCHKLVRGKLVAAAEGLPSPPDCVPKNRLTVLSLAKDGEKPPSRAQRTGWQSGNITTVMNGRAMVIDQN